jgi:PKD repeat protein
VNYNYVTQQNFAFVVADLWPASTNNSNTFYFYLNNQLVDSATTYAIIKLHKLGLNTVCTRLIGPNCNLEQCQEFNFTPPAIPNPCEVTFSKTYYGWFKESVRFFINKPSASYLWNFGDGNTSTAAEPTHTYTQDGIYEVCLTTQYGSCNFNYCDTVRINTDQACKNAFRSQIISRNTLDLSVSMPQVLLNPPASILWNFGDGQSSNQIRAFHYYENPGQYNVCMNLEIPERCSVMECRNINLQNYTSRLSGQIENHFQIPEVASSKIVLYEYVFDYNYYAQIIPQNFSYAVIARDTVHPLANGNFVFDSIPQGFYGLKLIPSEFQMSQNWVPSYGEFTPFWIQSQFRNGFLIQENMTANITAVRSENFNANGTGTIGGHLIEGPFRMSADHFDDAGLLLFYNNRLVNYRNIADSESFLYENLPFGIYTLVVDKTGFATQMKSIVLTPEQPNASVSINFYELPPYALQTENINVESAIEIFPNPTTNHIVMLWPNRVSNITIDFISSDGRILKTVQTQAAEMMTFDVSFVPSGLFFLRITDPYGTHVKKLIKN